MARIKALQAYARQERVLQLPIIGTSLRRHNEIVARLARIERTMGTRGLGGVAQQLSTAPLPVHPPVAAALDPAPHSASAVSQPLHQPDLPMLREARIETLDAATATKLEKDGWVFRAAVRDARRKESVKSRPEKARG